MSNDNRDNPEQPGHFPASASEEDELPLLSESAHAIYHWLTGVHFTGDLGNLPTPIPPSRPRELPDLDPAFLEERFPRQPTRFARRSDSMEAQYGSSDSSRSTPTFSSDSDSEPYSLHGSPSSLYSNVDMLHHLDDAQETESNPMERGNENGDEAEDEAEDDDGTHHVTIVNASLYSAIRSVIETLAGPNGEPATLDLACAMCWEPLAVPAAVAPRRRGRARAQRERILVLPCGHFFGHECVEKWVYARYAGGGMLRCPTCRRDVFHRGCGHPVTGWTVGAGADGPVLGVPLTLPEGGRVALTCARCDPHGPADAWRGRGSAALGDEDRW
ncbi:hypothetical protein GGR52DRAFT_26912 [Hypoxylon sp. FL1284]|nr:hypothetical protein GGR52DRAFT_26912 [Hypoxylon sp. FL1284]